MSGRMRIELLSYRTDDDLHFFGGVGEADGENFELNMLSGIGERIDPEAAFQALRESPIQIDARWQQALRLLLQSSEEFEITVVGDRAWELAAPFVEAAV